MAKLPACGATAQIIIACLLLVGCQQDKPRPASQAQAMTMPTDADSLCRDFGGVKELAAQTESLTRRERRTSIAAYCADGSYVARYVEAKR